MAHVVAEDHEVLLGLGVDDDDLRAELGSLAGARRAGVAGAAHHDLGVDGLGDLIGRDLGLLPEPAGTQDLTHRFALVAGKRHTGSGGRCRSGVFGGRLGRRALGGGGLFGQGGGRAACDGGSGHTRRTGNEAAARQGRGQGDGPAHLGELFDQLSLVPHEHSTFFLIVGSAARRLRNVRAAPRKPTPDRAGPWQAAVASPANVRRGASAPPRISGIEAMFCPNACVRPLPPQGYLEQTTSHLDVVRGF